MRTVERILFALILVSLLLKLLHIPLASFLLILASSTLAICYWISFLWFGTPTRKDQQTVLSVLAGLSFSIALIGLLFKLQYWPIGVTNIYLIIGAVSSIAVLVALFAKRSDSPELAAYHRSMIRRTLVIGVPTVLFYFTPSKDMARFQYRDDPVYAEMFILHMEHPQDTASWNALQRYQENKIREERSRER